MNGTNRGYTPDAVVTSDGQLVPVEMKENRVLWSSALVGSAQTANIELFRYSIGDNVAGKNNENVQADERHTNVQDSGLMDISASMNVWAIGIEFDYNVTKAALGQIMDKIYIQFKLSSQRPVYEGLVRHFPAGNGMFQQSTSNEDAVYSNGDPGAPRFQFQRPIELNAAKRYGATCAIKGGALTTASVDALMRVVFRGMGVSAP